MIITKQIEETKIVDVVDDILCNMCGETCNLAKDQGFIDWYGLIEAKYSGGYLCDDGCNFTFSLCTNCLRKMFKEFKIPAQITNWL